LAISLQSSVSHLDTLLVSYLIYTQNYYVSTMLQVHSLFTYVYVRTYFRETELRKRCQPLFRC